jgi:hypothetical protein
LCAIFIGNLHGTYENPSTAETFKTIKQKPDESLHEYVKCFCNARNTISYIQDIRIINTFYDGVSDIKTVQEIAMKKPKTVTDLLTVIDICIEASEVQVWILESRNKGPLKKQQQEDWEGMIRKRKDRFGDLLTSRSGVRFIALQGMI